MENIWNFLGKSLCRSSSPTLAMSALLHVLWIKIVLWNATNFLIPTRSSLYSTRKVRNIPLPNTKLNFFRNSFFPSTMTEWNNLDLHLRKSESFLVFKSNYLKFIRPSPSSVYNFHKPRFSSVYNFHKPKLYCYTLLVKRAFISRLEKYYI